MPKAFLVRKRATPVWCPVTPPPSPDELVAENLSVKQYQVPSSRPPSQIAFSAITDSVLNLKNTQSSNEDEMSAVDLTISNKSESPSFYSPLSALSSPLSYSASESDFDVKGWWQLMTLVAPGR